jgi:hypothetical protein
MPAREKFRDERDARRASAQIRELARVYYDTFKLRRSARV